MHPILEVCEPSFRVAILSQSEAPVLESGASLRAEREPSTAFLVIERMHRRFLRHAVIDAMISEFGGLNSM